MTEQKDRYVPKNIRSENWERMIKVEGVIFSVSVTVGQLEEGDNAYATYIDGIRNIKLIERLAKELADGMRDPVAEV